MSAADIDDGGQAFPGGPITERKGGHITVTMSTGMSLRDWMAGQALATLTVTSDYSRGPCDSSMAARAYAIADAMLAARKAK